ncbi:hypothetical protein CEQ48_17765 [Vibrio tarriae]|uniref:Polysaccharide biosynthesis protein C-terminal domain-containing protein n=1 Tax=Vibrio tarriae TaxID=2014742 RepID=A0AAU8WLA4_9VIBR|nr:polysaccharide biosynthesis C-terminal domain-containing protein [Vibrio tarriae]ASK56499.1 hypothetical protein CEQ48_17765 [Vibrio tarriae]
MIKTIFILLTSSVVSSLASFLTQMYIAKSFSPNSFGEFNSAISLVMLLTPLISMGVDGYLLKYYMENKGEIKFFNFQSVRYFFLTLAPCYILYIQLSSSYGFLFFIIVLSQAIINIAVAHSQIRFRFKMVSVLLAAQPIARLMGVVLLLIFNFLTPEKIYYLYSLISLCLFFLSLAFLIRINNNDISGAEQEVTLWTFVKNAYPFGLSVFFHLIYFQSDIFILNKLYSSEYAGYYSVAFTILISAYIVPSVIYQKFLLPKVHYINVNEHGKERGLFNNGFKVMFLLGSIGTLFFYGFSRDLIILIFDEQYINAVNFLKILSFCVFFRYLSSNAGVFLVTENLISIKNKYMALCAVLNLVLNIIFIPKYGAYAAALTTVLTEIVLCLLFHYGVNKYKFNIFN